MPDLAEAFRRWADDYLALHDATMLPSHRCAISDIISCRTEARGGHLWRCDACQRASTAIIPARIAAALNATLARPVAGWRAARCVFRRIRPGIPSEVGHRFRLKPAGDSDDP